MVELGGHRRGAHQRLAGAAGEHDDAAAAGPEVLHRQLLVGAELPAGLVQQDRVRRAVDVAGQVLGGPADLEQQLLELPALGRMHHHGLAVDPRAQQGGDLLGAADLLQHRVVGGPHHQAVLRDPFRAAAGRTGTWSLRRRSAANAAPGTGSTSAACPGPSRRRDRRPGHSRGPAASAGSCARAPGRAPARRRRRWRGGPRWPVRGRLRAGWSCHSGRSGVRHSLEQFLGGFYINNPVDGQDAFGFLFRVKDPDPSTVHSYRNNRLADGIPQAVHDVHHHPLFEPDRLEQGLQAQLGGLFAAGAAAGRPPAPSRGAAARRAAPPAGRRRRLPAARCAARCTPGACCRACAVVRRSRTHGGLGFLDGGDRPRLRSSWAVSRGRRGGDRARWGRSGPGPARTPRRR